MVRFISYWVHRIDNISLAPVNVSMAYYYLIMRYIRSIPMNQEILSTNQSQFNEASKKYLSEVGTERYQPLPNLIDKLSKCTTKSIQFSTPMSASEDLK